MIQMKLEEKQRVRDTRGKNANKNEKQIGTRINISF